MLATEPRPLTDRQAAILAWIRRHIDVERRPPTYREIADAFGIASPNGVRCHLQPLAKKGFLTILPGSRGIQLPRRPVDFKRQGRDRFAAFRRQL